MIKKKKGIRAQTSWIGPCPRNASRDGYGEVMADGVKEEYGAGEGAAEAEPKPDEAKKKGGRSGGASAREWKKKKEEERKKREDDRAAALAAAGPCKSRVCMNCHDLHAQHFHRYRLLVHTSLHH